MIIDLIITPTDLPLESKIENYKVWFQKIKIKGYLG